MLLTAMLNANKSLLASPINPPKTKIFLMVHKFVVHKFVNHRKNYYICGLNTQSYDGETFCIWDVG